MASTGLPYLEARRPTRESASPKLNISRCPSSLESPVGSARQSCPKNRNVSAGLGLVRIPDPPGRRSVGGRKPSVSPPPFLRLRSGSCSTHDVENVFQFSVDPVSDAEIAQPPRGSKCCFKRQFDPIVWREHREGFQFETEA